MTFIHQKYQAFIFDLDGTIYRGEKLIPKAAETVCELQRNGKTIRFISNKTTGTVADYHKFLKENGINVPLETIITATSVIKDFLKEKFQTGKFYAIAEKKFIDEILSEGFTFGERPEEIDFVIVTLDRTFTYEKLETAAKALEHGANFFAANIDATCPVEGGEIWDAGSTILALEKRTHRKLEDHFGKPSRYMFERVFSGLNVSREECLIIGDRLETDILLGNNFGIDTALVNTGVENYLNGNSIIRPTYRLTDIGEILTKSVPLSVKQQKNQRRY